MRGARTRNLHQFCYFLQTRRITYEAAAAATDSHVNNLLFFFLYSCGPSTAVRSSCRPAVLRSCSPGLLHTHVVLLLRAAPRRSRPALTATYHGRGDLAAVISLRCGLRSWSRFSSSSLLQPKSDAESGSGAAAAPLHGSAFALHACADFPHDRSSPRSSTKNARLRACQSGGTHDRGLVCAHLSELSSDVSAFQTRSRASRWTACV